MGVIPPIPQDYQRLIFGGLAFTGTMISMGVAATVPALALLAGDLAKIFAVGFVSSLAFYFGARGQT
jgi:hypothetical protein